MDRTEQDRVRIFDTTLRDGEQSPGIAQQEREARDRAPAPASALTSSKWLPDLLSGRLRGHAGHRSRGARSRDLRARPRQRPGRGRGLERDPETRRRIHTFISTSRTSTSSTSSETTREDVKGQARAAVAQARGYCDDVEFAHGRHALDLEFTAEVLQIALDEGATTINVPDTVGYSMPDEHAEMWRALPPRSRAGRRRDVGPLRRPGAGRGQLFLCRPPGGLPPGGVRGQRDRRTGRQRVARGNRDAHPRARGAHSLWTGVDTTEIARTSRMVSRITGYQVQPNKAIVGRNAFAHESGIHQDGVLKERTTYEIMDATTIGLETNALVLGKRTEYRHTRCATRSKSSASRSTGPL